VTTTLEIDRTTLESLVRYARGAEPEECCGVLMGDSSDGAVRVRRVLASENSADRPEVRFEIPPQTLLRAQKRARRESLEVVGYYHSHPRGSAVPSDADRADAWPGVSYLIVSGASRDAERGAERGAEGGAAEVRSWRLTSSGAFCEEEVCVGDEEQA
jgi:proteasome lid subunit RPN8/RPN11